MTQTLKFYTDTHIAKAVAVQLRNKGIDVIRCEEVGMAAADDEPHLEYAVSGGRVLISQDADFRVIHERWQKEGKAHSGIFIVPPHLQGERAISTIIRFVVLYYELIANDAGTIEYDINNQIITMSEGKS